MSGVCNFLARWSYWLGKMELMVVYCHFKAACRICNVTGRGAGRIYGKLQSARASEWNQRYFHYNIPFAYTCQEGATWTHILLNRLDKSMISEISLTVLYIDCMNDLEVWMFVMGDLEVLIFDVLVIERLCEVVEQAF